MVKKKPVQFSSSNYWVEKSYICLFKSAFLKFFALFALLFVKIMEDLKKAFFVWVVFMLNVLKVKIDAFVECLLNHVKIRLNH